MSTYTLEELIVKWKANIHTPHPNRHDAKILLTISYVGDVPCRVFWLPERAAYILEFYALFGEQIKPVELVIKDEWVRVIRRYIRHKIGIKYVPGLRKIGETSAVPPSCLPTLIHDDPTRQ